MAWTQTDVDALKAAIASGVLSVSFGDRTTVYKSTTEQLKALALMQQEVTAMATGGASTTRYASTQKGV